jgi:hypothetical protein
MRCQRCRGLLVRETFDGLSQEADIMCLATRCLRGGTCGGCFFHRFYPAPSCRLGMQLRHGPCLHRVFTSQVAIMPEAQRYVRGFRQSFYDLRIDEHPFGKPPVRQNRIKG